MHLRLSTEAVENGYFANCFADSDLLSKSIGSDSQGLSITPEALKAFINENNGSMSVRRIPGFSSSGDTSVDASVDALDLRSFLASFFCKRPL